MSTTIAFCLLQYTYPVIIVFIRSDSGATRLLFVLLTCPPFLTNSCIFSSCLRQWYKHKEQQWMVH